MTTPVLVVFDGSVVGRRRDWIGMHKWFRQYPVGSRVLRSIDGVELAYRCNQFFLPDVTPEFIWMGKENG